MISSVHQEAQQRRWYRYWRHGDAEVLAWTRRDFATCEHGQDATACCGNRGCAFVVHVQIEELGAANTGKCVPHVACASRRLSVRLVETSSHVSSEGHQAVSTLQAVLVWDRQAMLGAHIHISVHNRFF